MARFYSFPANFGEDPPVINIMGHTIPAEGGLPWDWIVENILDFHAFFAGFGVPNFGTYEAMREWFAQFDMMLPEQGPHTSVYVNSRTLLTDAHTLRQRCFARLFNGITTENEISLHPTIISKRPIKPFKLTTRSLMAACYRDKEIRAALRDLPLSRTGTASFADPELEDALQDLADIIAWEARAAFEADYYPGVVDVDPLTDEQVDTVMWGMQREMNREAQSRNRTPIRYADLPRDRQVALAERRRYWFGVFGITQESWKTGRWNLWKVKNVSPPEGPTYQYEVPRS